MFLHPHRFDRKATIAREDTQFKPGNPGGPGRIPTRVGPLLRAVADADSDDARSAALARAMRNPVAAAFIRAMQDEDARTALEGATRTLDRLEGKAAQSVSVDGELHVSLERVLLDDAAGQVDS